MNGVLVTSLINRLKTYLLKVRWNHFYKNNRLPEISLEDLGIAYNPHTPTTLEEICIPPYLGDDDLDDFALLFSLLDHFKPKKLLELGTAHGNTVANICSRFDTQVITVNALSDQIAGRVITYSLKKEEIGSVYEKLGFSNRVTQIFEDTKKLDLGKFTEKNTIDFAIIDACHDSDFVINDFLKIQPFMTSGSMVILHDTHPSLINHFIDSYIGCMYLRKLGYNIMYLKNSSWAVWTANDNFIKRNFPLNLVDRPANIIERKIFGSPETDVVRLRERARDYLKEK